ncbi:hypothetical protein Tco_0676614 [Tanacetum coccineum]
MKSVPPRRNSLIPLPSSTTITKFVPPLPSIAADDKENVDEPESSIVPLVSDSPKRSNGSEKKLMSALRRSLSKKNQKKSPIQQAQQIRKIGGLNVAVERVRVSIGSRGRMAHRVLANGRRIKQQNCMDRERRWNIERPTSDAQIEKSAENLSLLDIGTMSHDYSLVLQMLK